MRRDRRSLALLPRLLAAASSAHAQTALPVMSRAADSDWSAFVRYRGGW